MLGQHMHITWRTSSTTSGQCSPLRLSSSQGVWCQHASIASTKQRPGVPHNVILNWGMSLQPWPMQPWYKSIMPKVVLDRQNCTTQCIFSLPIYWYTEDNLLITLMVLETSFKPWTLFLHTKEACIDVSAREICLHINDKEENVCILTEARLPSKDQGDVWAKLIAHPWSWSTTPGRRTTSLCSWRMFPSRRHLPIIQR